MHVLLTTDWSVLASIATVAGTAIAAAALVGTGLALAAQIWLACTSSGIDNLWRLVDKWDGDDMVSKRARAAQAMKRHDDTDDVADVLNFFEQLGYLGRWNPSPQWFLVSQSQARSGVVSSALYLHEL